jgi:hypothetical protein
MSKKNTKKSTDQIVEERLLEFTERLMDLFPEKEYDLRKLINEVSYSGLDDSVNAVEVLEDPVFEFIWRQEGQVVDWANVPGYIKGMPQKSEISVAIKAIAEKLHTDFTSDDKLTLQDITKSLQKQVIRLKGLDRIRELAGVKILGDDEDDIG